MVGCSSATSMRTARRGKPPIGATVAPLAHPDHRREWGSVRLALPLPLLAVIKAHTVCEKIVHLGYKEITHLGYVLWSALRVQSDPSSSRVPSESSPSQERGPAFLLPVSR